MEERIWCLTVRQMTMTNEQVVAIAEKTVDDLMSGGYLTESQAERFINLTLECYGIKVDSDNNRVNCMWCGSSWPDEPYSELMCACTRVGNWNPNVVDEGFLSFFNPIHKPFEITELKGIRR